MNPTPVAPDPEDEPPFVHEECGDTMWEPVLAQPQPPATPLPVNPLPPASPKDQEATGPSKPQS